MMLITMRLLASKRSQYMWHVGEPWPVPRGDEKEVLELFADGDEKLFLGAALAAGIRCDWRLLTLKIEGEDAVKAATMMAQITTVE